MALFSDLGKKFTEASQGAIAKTKDFADIAKLNSNISDEEKRITNAYTKIGMDYVAKHIDDYDEEFKDSITIITEAKAKIADYEKQIKNIKGVVKCPACGAEVPQDATFCATCGAAIVHEEEPVKEAKVCPNCGEKITDGAAFCMKCGTKIEEE